MTELRNPFDDEAGTFAVLVNDLGQHCIWPTFAAHPDGWTSVLASSDRATALAYVEENWTDMRPRRVSEDTTRHSG